VSKRKTDNKQRFALVDVY